MSLKHIFPLYIYVDMIYIIYSDVHIINTYYYLIRIGTHDISDILEVKGEAILASVSDNDIPALAAFNACS